MQIIKFLNPARDQLKVSKYSIEVLKDIMKQSNISELTITSTARTPAEQARIMFENIKWYGEEHQKRLYGGYGDQVIDHYTKLKKENKSDLDIISGMEEKINDLGPMNVSRHVGDPSKLNVIDIAPSSIGIAARKGFENAVRNEPRVNKFLLPPKDPAYHLEISQP